MRFKLGTGVRRKLLTSTELVGVLACLLAGVAHGAWAQQAAPPGGAKEYEFNLERLPATEALEQFFGTVRLSYGFLPSSPEVERIPIGPLKGRYTMEAGLSKLLAPVGFTFGWVNAQTIIVAEPEVPKPAQDPKPDPDRVAPAAHEENVERRSTGNTLIERVIVTAGRMRDIELSASPVETIERRSIQERGVSTVAELLKSLSQQPYAHGEGFRASGAQFAELRGLGPDMTLVLINGRRVLPSATNITTNAFDLNSIPIAAVDRVEVLFDSASAMYGTDAIGGVVNIVLRRDIPEPTLEIHYGSADGGAEQRRATLSGGYHGSRAHGTLVLDYFDITSLLGQERGRWRDQDFRRFGGLDQRSINSAPGNITSLTAANLPGLSSRFAAVPRDPSVDFSSTAGEHNLESLFRYWSLVPEGRRFSTVALGELAIAPSLTATAEVLHVVRSATFQFSPPMIPGLPVAATNAFNPFGIPVATNVLLSAIAPQAQNVDSQLTRWAAALRGKHSAWEWELSAVQTDERASAWIDRALDFGQVSAALAQPNPDLALNVFQEVPGGSPQLLESLLADRKTNHLRSYGTQVNGFASGALPLRTPAGALTVTTGGEWREEIAQFDATLGSYERSIEAAFAELRIPLVDPRMSWTAVSSLSLALSGRLDDYNDFGSIVNPQYGLVWRVNREVMVRGTYGRSFRAPSLYELFLPKIPTPTQFADPRRRGEPASFTLLAGGNEALDPTRGESMTAGLVVKPTALPGLELSATYWRIAVDDRVVLLSLPSLLANEGAFADRVVRAEPSVADLAAGVPGALRSVDISRMNFGQLKTSGIDLSAQYKRETAFGDFTPRLSATWIDRFETEDVPTMPTVDRVGVANFTGTIAKWRAIGTFGWRRGVFGAAASARYSPHYEDAVAGIRTGRVIPSQTVIDLQISADLNELDERSPWHGLSFALGANNLLDEHAPFAEVSGAAGFDLSQGDLKGRFLYIRLGRSF